MQIPDWLDGIVTKTMPDSEYDAGYTSRDLITLHSTEGYEIPGSASSSASWLASNRGGAASTHFTIDDADIILSVDPDNTAWAAPGVNPRAVNIEQAGQAGQTWAQWRDPYSVAVVTNTARVVRRVADHYRIPLAFVDAAGILAGARGITTHAEVTKAYPHLGDGHTDPGPNYPLAQLLELAGGTDTITTTTQEEDMPLTEQDLDAIAARVLTIRLSTNAGEQNLSELTTRSTLAAEQARDGIAEVSRKVDLLADAAKTKTVDSGAYAQELRALGDAIKGLGPDLDRLDEYVKNGAIIKVQAVLDLDSAAKAQPPAVPPKAGA